MTCLFEQQQGESNQAFAAFRVYLEMGDKRSLRAVGQKCDKSRSLLGRWSSRWGWPKRVQAYNESLVRGAQQKALQRRLLDIMCMNEVLARVSMLARASPLDLMDEDWNVDVKKAKQAGLGYLVNGVKRQVTTSRDGSVTETIEVKVENRAKYLELMGRHFGLWEDEEDFERAAQRLLIIETEARRQLALADAGEETTP